MKTIWIGLTTGTAKDRLAVASDVVSIVGISAGSLLTATLALHHKLVIDNIFGLLIFSSLGIALIAAVLLLTLWAQDWVAVQAIGSAPKICAARVIVWSMFSLCSVVLAYAAWFFITATQFIK